MKSPFFDRELQKKIIEAADLDVRQITSSRQVTNSRYWIFDRSNINFLMLFALMTALFILLSSPMMKINQRSLEKKRFISKTKVPTILAFGDSLTEGMCPGGFHSYSIKLQGLLGTHAIVDQKGVSGETTISMVKRLPEVMRPTKYSIVCILGGTNDLARYKIENATTIFSRLRKLYDTVLQNEAKLLIISIPESEFQDPQYVQLRHDVNALITEYYMKHKAEGRVKYLDLESKIPFNVTTRAPTSLWSFDGLHMTALGYDRFGALVFDSISSWIVMQ